MPNPDTEFRALQLLRVLERCSNVSQRELANEIGLSVSRTNHVLRTLVEKGWVKAENFSQSPNKLGYLYLLTPAGVIEKMKLVRRFLIRKQEEYDALAEEIAELEAELSEKEL
jgi:EPS-associated MarR family transcriptional regulator